MKRYRAVFGWMLSLVVVCGSGHAPLTAQTPPNVVVIVADDLGYGDLESYGARDMSTPALNRLASEGVRFTTFYSNGPECTPTRAALLTGRYQQRVGGLETAVGLGGVGRYDEALWLSERGELGLPPTYNTLASGLKARGYQTAIIGKWHLGYDKFQPVHHPFDYSLTVLGGAVDYFHHTEPVGMFIGHLLAGDHDLYRNGKPHDRQGTYATDLFTDEAVAWLGRQRAEVPFFLYLPYTTPHSPYQGPNDYRPEKLTVDDWSDGSRETLVEMIEAMDRGIGRVLAKLDEKGFTRNTLVIFVSDNGGTGPGTTGPLSGRKGSTFEGGIRVPAIVRWPGHLRPGTVSSQVAITMDLTASILRAAGAAPLPNLPLDGIDILRHVEQGRPDQLRTLFWRIRREKNVRKAVRDGNMKYVYDFRGEGAAAERVFDLTADVAEKNDLSTARPQELERLRRLLARWEEEVKPTRPELSTR